jgi:polyhydroxyalkanoate synthase
MPDSTDAPLPASGSPGKSRKRPAAKKAAGPNGTHGDARADSGTKPTHSTLNGNLDAEVRAGVAKLFGGMSPVHLTESVLDWAMHLAMSPGKQISLVQSAASKAVRLADFAARAMSGSTPDPVAETPAHDPRFKHQSWQRPPFNILSQGFLLSREWAAEATTGISGVTRDHEATVGFLAHQFLDAVSPHNIPIANPEVITTTLEEKGQNLRRGLDNLVEDTRRHGENTLPEGTEGFGLGEQLATTPGKVIFRNRIMEIIQYEPTTAKVHTEPVLMIPPWIMKYYVLDLSPKNSLVRWLIEQGHTVFMLSWKNPDKDDADLGLNDYLKLGFYEALDTVNAVCPKRKVNVVGYCAGGTLVAMGAATMARDGDRRLNSVTTFTAQTDCTEPGEIKIFLSEAELAMLKPLMEKDGYLDKHYFAKAFGALNVNALIWRPAVERYLLGQERQLIDLMAWNTDTTRVPARLHYEWLYQLFLNNELAEDHYQVDGKNIHLSDIRVPMHFVGTTTDHVAPWKSVYKIHRLAPNCELTFTLTTGGHNAGIIPGPDHPRRSYQVTTRAEGEAYVAPDRWAVETPSQPGSWWRSWEKWLTSHARGAVRNPPAMGAAAKGYKIIEDAPGTYVRQL